MEKNIKNVKGARFTCAHCGTSVSFIFETQKSYINECPNCSAEWLPQQLNVEAMRNLKYALRTLRDASGAQIDLICEDEQ